MTREGLFTPVFAKKKGSRYYYENYEPNQVGCYSILETSKLQLFKTVKFNEATNPAFRSFPIHTLVDMKPW